MPRSNTADRSYAAIKKKNLHLSVLDGIITLMFNIYLKLLTVDTVKT